MELWIVLYIFAACAGLAIGGMLIFYLRSERYKDKWIKSDDALLQLANKDNHFKKKESLLRQDELEFYNVLQGIINNQYTVLPQVRLSDLVSIKNDSRDHENLYHVLGNKSVDYAVFTKATMAPVLAIELNGASHFAANRQNRDQVVKALLEGVGINFLPVDKNSYKKEELSEKLKNLLSEAQ